RERGWKRLLGFVEHGHAVLRSRFESATLDADGYDLSAVASRTHARGAMDVDTDVPAVDDQRLPGVQPHSHTDRSLREPLLCLLRAGHRGACRAEDEEEGVALCIDLEAVIFCGRLPNE